MASRLKKWILIVGVGCTLLTLWLVPPQPWIFSRWLFIQSSWRTPERIEANRMLAEARRTNAVLQRLRMVDSLSTFVVETSGSVGPVVVSLPDEVREEFVEKIRSAVQTEVDYVGTPNPDVAIGLMMVEKTYGSYLFIAGADYSTGSEYYAGMAAERPFCFVVRPYHDENRYGPVSDRVAAQWSFGTSAYPTDALGPCGFYLAHGPPGPTIATWLRDAGAWLLTDSRWMGERTPFTVLDHRVAFGIWNPNGYRYLGSVASEGCLAGRVEACRQALRSLSSDPADSQVYREVAEWIHSDRPRWLQRVAFTGQEAWWMGDLESEFGRERFARFWRSDQSVDDAFLAAFGESIESWTMRWAQRRMGVQKASPSTDGLSVLLTFLTLLACAGIAVTTGTRRRV